jgi:CBS domain-containing protein
MTHHRIRHLPVLEGLELVGIVSMGDLVISIIADQACTIDELHRTWGEVRGLG